MKKAILYFIIIIGLMASCKKAKDEESPKSHWIVDGITYKGFAKTHPAGLAFDVMEGANRYATSNNFISINFFNSMPATSRMYTVKKKS